MQADLPDRDALLIAGAPSSHLTLYHRVGFRCGDPAAFIQTPQGSTFIVRDIELPRAAKQARADLVARPNDFMPDGVASLSGDRETATAQAAAECLRRAGVKRVRLDRHTGMIYADHCRAAGVEPVYDPELGVADRRVKTAEEQQGLEQAQAVTQQGIELVCRLIARAEVGDDGVLMHEGKVLTSEIARRAASVFFLDQGFSEPAGSIVAGFPHTADCHHRGAGPLRTGQAVIVDLFPCDAATGLFGDCTRTVVHGQPSEAVQRMHDAVLASKAAAESVCRPGATGGEVHQATQMALRTAGFAAPDEAPEGLTQEPTMPHGTGHGVGLAVHEPILLAAGVTAPLLAGEALTIEPGLYSTRDGGVRVEDLVLTTDDGCRVVGDLPTGLDWT